jgi:hypothetical protein
VQGLLHLVGGASVVVVVAAVDVAVFASVSRISVLGSGELDDGVVTVVVAVVVGVTTEEELDVLVDVVVIVSAGTVGCAVGCAVGFMVGSIVGPADGLEVGEGPQRGSRS